MNIYNCKICNQEYEPTRKDNVYCSQKCKFEAKKKQRTLKYKKNCVTCQKEFETFDKRKIYCSQKCFGVSFSLKNSIVFNCEYCGKENRIKHSREGQRFCNKQCRLLKEPISTTDEVKEKISLSREKYIGENHPMFGKHHSKESKEKISNVHKELGKWKGEKNPAFGGLSNEIKNKISSTRTRKILSGEIKCRTVGQIQTLKGGLIKYKSNWEKLFIEQIESDPKIIKFNYEPFSMKYIYDHQRNYIPDFEIIFIDGTKKLIEVKPNLFLEFKINKAKFAAAKEYCKQNNMIFEVWTEKSNPYGILK